MNKNPRKPMSIGLKIILWTIASVLAGIISGYIGVLYAAPFFFGFFLAFVLVGLIALFAFAVHFTNEQH